MAYTDVYVLLTLQKVYVLLTVTLAYTATGTVPVQEV